MARGEKEVEIAESIEEKTARELDSGVISEVGVKGADGVEEADGATVGRDDCTEETRAGADAAGETRVGTLMRESDWENGGTVTSGSRMWESK